MVLSFSLREVCPFPTHLMAGQGIFILLCMDLRRGRRPGSSKFVTQNLPCATFPSFPRLPSSIEQHAKLGDATAAGIWEIRRKISPEDNGYVLINTENHGQAASDSKGWRKQGGGNMRDEQEDDGRKTSPKRESLNEERWQ